MDIIVPQVGESVTEALISRWLKKDGDVVRQDEPVCEIETDKITMEIPAAASGTITTAVPEGSTVKIGAVIGTIEEAETPPPPEGEKPPPRQEPAREGLVPPSARRLARAARPAAAAPEPAAETAPAPAASPSEPAPTGGGQADGRVTRTPMSPIRKRIAERLLAVRQQTAMLTTFNEADLGRVSELRKAHGEQFRKRHGVKLGLMSFFVKACCLALGDMPLLNASIEGDEIVQHHYLDIGIAISAEKGLVVPVLRDADRLNFAQIESAIREFSDKIAGNRLSIAELEGGTFTITNGGIFGSLLSTPILNPPQSGVLGMHAIQERPVVREGVVVIRPMMYLALSYDHRIVDGREAVLFLKRVKELIEEPEALFLEA